MYAEISAGIRLVEERKSVSSVPKLSKLHFSLKAKMEAKRHLQNKKDKPIQLVKPETPDSAPILKFASVRKR